MTPIPIQQDSRRRKALRAWFNPRGRGLGFIAFALHRITGIGLTLYLLLHMVVLSILLQGEDAWDRFVAVAKSPVMLLFDLILIAGILIHGLNGLRVSLVGLGFGVRQHKILFWIVMLLSALIFLYTGWLMMRA